jgi:hypothetical protein
MTAAATIETITVIRARGRRLAKVIRGDGTVEGYDSARRVDLVQLNIPNLLALELLLRWLERQQDCCVVRGGIADAARVCHVRRLLHADPKTGDIPTLRDVPRRWVAFDFDDVPRPENVAVSDLVACARVAIRALPKVFHDTACIAQATARHGITSGVVRLRLWHWLDRPANGAELRRWLHGVPVDHSVFGAVQPIYTAAPLFCGGATDPLDERLIRVQGARAIVPVPPASALTPPPPRMAVTPDAGRAARYGFTALTAATARVVRAADGIRHPTLLAEACGLAGLVSRGLLPDCTAATALAGAAEMAGLPAAEAASIIAWALAHPRKAAR